MNVKALSSVSAVMLAAFAAEAKITVTQDHADALYRTGEETVFTVEVTDDVTGALVKDKTAKWTLDNFGDIKIASGQQDLAQANPFTVKGKLDGDGFLRLIVNASTNRVVWGVGYDVTKIRQDEPCPADFDAYWAAEKARIRREVPLDAKKTRDEKLSDAKFDVYRVNFATFNGQRVYGFLTVPVERKGLPLPLHVNVPGAGPGLIAGSKIPNAVSLAMNVHMFEPETTHAAQKKHMEEVNAALAKKFALPNGKAYCAQAGIAVSREAYHYHDVMLGIDRAVDWAVALPEVDAKRVVYSGSSQGGMFGLYLSYLNANISRAFVAVCAGTGHYAYRQKRQNGWPNLIYSQTREKRPEAEKYMGYFDGVNFAARVKIPIRFVVSLADQTCPPHDVYAAFNVCPSADKEITNAIGAPHSWTSVPSGAEAGRRYRAWLFEK